MKTGLTRRIKEISGELCNIYILCNTLAQNRAGNGTNFSFPVPSRSRQTYSRPFAFPASVNETNSRPFPFPVNERKIPFLRV